MADWFAPVRMFSGPDIPLHTGGTVLAGSDIGRLLSSSSGLAILAASLLAVTASPALAQSQPSTEASVQAGQDAVEIDEVVVTGSRIRRDPTTAPTPLQQVSREQVLESGQANVIDYLADIPALQSSVVPEDTTGAALGAGGLSLLDLRGLGSSRTLVLVDGRRHAGAAYFASNSVDIDTIPRLLIESVELITGGASAVYGADAVAGVVNFIQRDNVEGFEIDAALGEINDDGQLNRRLSILWGGNTLEGRLRGYVSGEFEKSDEVQDRDIEIMRRNAALYQNDLDDAAVPNDGVFDVLAGIGFQTISRPRGGVLTLSHNTVPSPASDPDIPAASCTTAGFSANCFVLDPGFSFVFDGATARGLDFGTARVPAGLNRTLTRGSRDGRALIDQSATSRLPESKAYRFQTGGVFELTDSIEAFAEAKYVTEETNQRFSASFFNIGIRPYTATQQSQFIGGLATTFEIGLNNAYLPASLRTQIQTNTRGGVADPRAFFQNYLADLPLRPQENTRDTYRGLVGLKGEIEAFGPLKDANWEISYSRSEVSDQNFEPGLVDSERYMFAADAVVDTAGLVNGRPGEIVCRVRLNAAQGNHQRLAVDVNAGVATPRTYAPTDPAIAGCQPINIFGADGVPDGSLDYLLSEQARGFTMGQENALAFMSGDLWDFWGAGPIGVAFGAEYRFDSFSGNISGDNRANRILLGNVFIATPERDYSSVEGFVELQLPLLRDLPLIQSLDISGAYRYSDYSQFESQEVYSGQASWRINDSLLLRATHGTAIRAAALNELYRSPGQTFANIVDNCSRDQINATADARIRENRNRNCAALGIPATYFDPTPGGATAGVNGPNALLKPEQSVSTTASIVFTPSSWPDFSMVLDYYEIEITDAINSLSVATLLNLCTDQDVLNRAACDQITRSPTNFDITTFVQGFFNFAKQTAQGVDFAARYSQDLEELTGRPWGKLDLGVRGTWNMSRRDFGDALNPKLFVDLNDGTGMPTVRFLATTTWSKGSLGISWNIDYQTSHELFDVDIYKSNPDNRPLALLETGDFVQHDVTLRYDLTDRIRLRGGVVNLLDENPSVTAQVGGAGNVNQFDIFGRRFFVGVNARF